MGHIKLKSSDGEIFAVEFEVAKCLGIINTLLENCSMDDDNDDIIPLPNVNSTILRKILIWASHHKNDPEPNDDENSVHISSWDKDFLNVDRETIFGLIAAADYLDIKALFNILCETTADVIKTKTTEEIRQIFNAENDFAQD